MVSPLHRAHQGDLSQNMLLEFTDDFGKLYPGDKHSLQHRLRCACHLFGKAPLRAQREETREHHMCPCSTYGRSTFVMSLGWSTKLHLDALLVYHPYSRGLLPRKRHHNQPPPRIAGRRVLVVVAASAPTRTTYLLSPLLCRLGSARLLLLHKDMPSVARIGTIVYRLLLWPLRALARNGASGEHTGQLPQSKRYWSQPQIGDPHQSPPRQPGL